MTYYAQTNYSQLQGMTVNGVHPRYSIHDIGCFITSFCNILKRFGTNIAPDKLDNALAAKKLYIDVDDGVFDDVGWNTLCAYDPSIKLLATGTGKPKNNDSIVKFAYNSFQTGKPTTHFCAVLDAKKSLIIDSWDGQVKSWNAYPGGPVEWATYAKSKPAPTKPRGDDMITKNDILELHAVMRDIKGWNEANVDAGKYDDEELQAWLGKTWTQYITEAVNDSKGYRTKRDTAFDYYSKKPANDKALTTAKVNVTTLGSTNKSLQAKVDELTKAVNTLSKHEKQTQVEIVATNRDNNDLIWLQKIFKWFIAFIEKIRNKKG